MGKSALFDNFDAISNSNKYQNEWSWNFLTYEEVKAQANQSYENFIKETKNKWMQMHFKIK